tara:strand:+ start:281 stop:985 length:705 start_codon:yes stop_codon:yes gene_type:complete
MSLPVINTPTYELVQPSTKDTITFRPFLVKEEKILLLALEENNENSLAMSLKQIINNCTFEQVNVDILPLFDLEYMFLKIRAKSVGETAKVRLLCEDDGETYAEVEIDLEEVEVSFPEKHTNTINITDEVVLEMRYPTYELLGTGTDELTVDKTFDLIGACINRMIEGENIYDRADWTEEELRLFIENLTSKQFAELQIFFETMPKLSKEVSYTNPKTKKKNKMTLEGLQSFFV